MRLSVRSWGVTWFHWRQDGSNMITWFALHISFNEEILSLQFHSEAAETFTQSSLTVQFSSCYFRKLFVCYLNIILLHNKLYIYIPTLTYLIDWQWCWIFRLQTAESSAKPYWELETFESLSTCCEAVTNRQTPH